MRFSAEQEASIERKIKLFSPILKDALSYEEIIRRTKEIEQRLVEKKLIWWEENKARLEFLSRKDITDLQKAVLVLFPYQMEVTTGLTIVPFLDFEQGIFAVHILSRNFCPYLEAFKRMGIKAEDSVKLCELALEKPCQTLVEKVNPTIRFFRDYKHLRPIYDCCSESMIMRANHDTNWQTLSVNYDKQFGLDKIVLA